ncbi:TIGR03086 family metal-binding protein [Mycolicibacterium pyrenivorans]|uniref:TIGR03086 family metal-binding protein n=1 Tax=Mycolicibacterium pyrenivorans TaxID=187102 RepID=UPI0021F3816E|nr:TIGR03086 family metal-binding protein [Mycolicibacterium pyrenivorans]MCV7152591.1 TIGR03086 family protein [Mycolicibacterium pyrenivorans]
MPTFYEHHRTAVQASVDAVAAVVPADLGLATPCAGWTLADLLVHMTAQHRGFAAAALGHGADPDAWRAEPIAAAVRADPVTTYAAAAHEVLAAFAADGVDEAPFALPEFGKDVTLPGRTAMGFHFVDYVAHGWDVAVTLGNPFTLPADVIAAVLPLVMDVPDGDLREADDSPFARALGQTDDDDDFARILRHLGRHPDWRRSTTAAEDATA